MKPTDQHIDDLFRDGMEGHTEMPPAPVWKAIEERLDNQERKRGGGWIRPLLCVLLFVLLGGTAVMFALRARSGRGIGTAGSGDYTAAGSTSVARAAAPHQERPATQDLLTSNNNKDGEGLSKSVTAKKSADTKDMPKESSQPIASVESVVSRTPEKSASTRDVQSGKPTLDTAQAVTKRKTHRAATREMTAGTKSETATTQLPHSHSKPMAKQGPVRQQMTTGSRPVLPTTKANEDRVDNMSVAEHSVSGRREQPSRPATISKVPARYADTDAGAASGQAVSNKERNAAAGTQAPVIPSAEQSPSPEIPAVPGQLISSVKPDTSAARLASELSDAKSTSSDSGAAERTSAPDPSAQAAATVTKSAKRNRKAAQSAHLPAESDLLLSSGKDAGNASAGKKRQGRDQPKELEKSDARRSLSGNYDKDTARLSSGIAGTKGGLTTSGVAPKEKVDGPLRHTSPFYFRAGLMAGRETGFSAFRGNKTVLDVFFEWTAFGKFGIGIAPAIKWGKTNLEYTSGNGNYVDPARPEVTVYDQVRDSIIGFTGYASYAFVQKYDSLSATKTLARSYREVELPISLLYHLTKNWTISGGVNLVWGSVPAFTGTVNRTSGLILRDTVRRYYDTAFIGPAAASKFAHPGVDSFSTYKDPASDPVLKPFRYGYTLAFRYTHRYGVSAELSMRQQLGGLSGVADPKLKSLLSQPYFRISIGYEIGHSKK